MIKQNFKLIKQILDQHTIHSILIISVVTSLLTFIIPVAAQTLMNFVAFGKIFRPVYTICTVVFILMTGAAILSIWQMILIELIQRRFLVMLSLKMTAKLITLTDEAVVQQHGAVLVNRFFEVVTIRKALASCLLYGFEVALQLIFGLILLIVYHPLFIWFDLLMVGGLGGLIYWVFQSSIFYAEKECSVKHQLGGWLEDVFQYTLFKFGRGPAFAERQMDKKLIKYLSSRSHYFRELVKLQIGLHVLSIVATVLLLGLGSYLIIKNQLSLGQLVASELILTTIISAFKRISTLLESFYELQASAEKVQSLFQLCSEPTLESRGVLLPDMAVMKVQLEGIRFSKMDESNAEPLHAEVYPQQPLVLFHHAPVYCANFIDVFLGKQDYDGQLMINEQLFDTTRLCLLRPYTLLLRDIEWFNGTVAENLFLEKNRPSKNSLLDDLSQLDVLDSINSLPSGLQTTLVNWRSAFTTPEMVKLMFIRALIAKPKLLLIDRMLDNLDIADLKLIHKRLQSMPATTLVMTTQCKDVASIFGGHVS